MLEINIEKIEPNHLNPRTSFTKEGLEQLLRGLREPETSAGLIPVQGFYLKD